MRNIDRSMTAQTPGSERTRAAPMAIAMPYGSGAPRRMRHDSIFATRNGTRAPPADWNSGSRSARENPAQGHIESREQAASQCGRRNQLVAPEWREAERKGGEQLQIGAANETSTVERHKDEEDRGGHEDRKAERLPSVVKAGRNADKRNREADHVRDRPCGKIAPGGETEQGENDSGHGHARCRKPGRRRASSSWTGNAAAVRTRGCRAESKCNQRFHRFLNAPFGPLDRSGQPLRPGGFASPQPILTVRAS